MSEVEELEARILNLPREAIAELRDWFLALDDRLWDEQIAADSRAGRFRVLIDEARREFARGTADEL